MPKIAVSVLVVAILVTAIFAIANTISGVTPPPLGQLQFAITADTLKPSQCDGITLTNLVTSNGNVNGTAANDLILGGPATQTIRGLGGNDCILGGGSTARSTLDGDSTAGEPIPATTDVCLIQAGTTVTYRRCEITGTYP